MNILSILSRLFIITMLATSVYAQQQFTHTVTPQNKGCNAVCSVMDVAELNNNPAAIILITPLDNPGKALFLDKTGHSLDNERRSFWAQQILDFIK